jgi:protein-L-isoaspartate(D-aspartate) O-methyltransferase
MDDRDAARHGYAETVCATANVRSPALRAAFACVAREQFLGPGPWHVMRSIPPPSDGIYEATANADPRHPYADVLVAIDAARCLNNGQPSALARWIDALDLCTGDRAPSTRPTTLALAPSVCVRKIGKTG